MVDVSVPCDARIVKFTPADFADTQSADGAITVPNAWHVNLIKELAVTAVVATTIVPAIKATVPAELAPAVALLPTLVYTSLFPAVPFTMLPLVAVMLPKVAVMLVPAVTEVPADNEPRVAEILPAEATMLPVVEVIPVPAVIVVVAASVVVVVKEPGAVIAAGREKVIVLPEPVEVIWLAVPSKFILPAVGLKAPPEPPVNVTIAPVVPEPKEIQLPEPGHI
jgi:hypothetical protein